jgi:hypothetical protein
MFSCTQERNDSVEKLIFARITSMPTYDSLGKPHIVLQFYLKYDNSKEVRLAKGNSRYIYINNAPFLGLDSFYKSTLNDSVKQIIDKTFKTSSYDSFYFGDGEMLRIFLIIYRIHGQEKWILYDPGQISSELLSLHKTLIKSLDTHKLVESKVYSIDNSLIQFEKVFYKIFKPPPTPSKVGSTP